jgi:hypothetical protein
MVRSNSLCSTVYILFPLDTNFCCPQRYASIFKFPSSQTDTLKNYYSELHTVVEYWLFRCTKEDHSGMLHDTQHISTQFSLSPPQN